MKTKPFFAVIGGTPPRVRRVAQRWPSLAAGEAIVRLTLELPDDFLTAPAHTLEVPVGAVTVAVEAEEVND